MTKKKSDFIQLNYTEDPEEFKRFVSRLCCKKLRNPLGNTLANIFTMRYIGNKTHGDMAEVGLTEFIRIFMYDFDCIHVGKDFFRSKKHEEDIAILNNLSNNKGYIPVSLKAYGLGPIQLSTDKENILYNKLDELKIRDSNDKNTINTVSQIIKETILFNVIPLIYEENIKGNRCNIFIFNAEKMSEKLNRIVFVDKGQVFSLAQHKVIKKKSGKQRVHPIFMFLDENDNYICEVRYGGRDANALQRGLWSDTKKGKDYFTILFDEWIKYDKQEELLSLFGLALNSTKEGHLKANSCLKDNINKIAINNNIKIKWQYN